MSWGSEFIEIVPDLQPLATPLRCKRKSERKFRVDFGTVILEDSEKTEEGAEREQLEDEGGKGD